MSSELMTISCLLMKNIYKTQKNISNFRIVRDIAFLCRPPVKEFRLRPYAADEVIYEIFLSRIIRHKFDNLECF